MRRPLTPRSSLENLKREAKRWLKALRDRDPAARARYASIRTDSVANSANEPTLRDVQHALALEYGYDGWTSLTAAVASIARVAGHAEHPTVVALLDAASRGDDARITDILDANPRLVSERAALGNSGLRSALHVAVGSAHEQTVKLLLDRAADPNVRDEGDNAMPLHFAAEKEHLGIVRLLIEHGADPIGAGDMHELEVIGWATVFGSARRDVFEYLLAHGARHNISSAVATGNVDAIRAIVAATPAVRDKPMDATNHRRRPLHLAIVKKQPASLATLLSLGADTELVDAAGLTPLDQAALANETAMVEMLLEHGATLRLPAAVALDRDVERVLRENPGELAPGRRWGTLIVHAAERAPARVVEALIRHGASPNAHDDEQTSVDRVSGYTPLHAAAFNGNADAAAALLAHGASVAARDSKYHGTPAGWADYAQHPELRDMILRGPIDMFDAIAFDRVNRLRAIFDRDTGALNRPIGASLIRQPAPDEWIKPWWTPLAIAVALGKADAVRELLEIGARPDVRDPNGLTLRDIAARDGKHDIVRFLDQYAVGTDDDAAAPRDASDRANDRAALVARFLANACPDHHIRGGHMHDVARHLAGRLLARHPELAHENLFTAIVCGNLDYVEFELARNPAAARSTAGPKGSADAQRQRFVVSGTSAAHPRWDPLLYLCFTRLDRAETNDNAVAIARALLDHGADPNAYFMAGDSRYSPLTGVVGEGEENRLPHPRRDELVRLLLERGANPYDVQVFYNLNFDGDLLWFLRFAYEESVKRGRRADWDDPEWRMFDMGGYGTGARYTLDIAVKNNDLALAAWALDHGANPNAGPASDRRLPQTSLYESARLLGLDDVAELLRRHGATVSNAPLDVEHEFIRACAAGDTPAARALLAAHPTLRHSHTALHQAAQRDDRDVAEFILDLGVSPNVADPAAADQLAIHVAALRGSIRVARLLVERRADVDRREGRLGATPLGFAIYAQKRELIELLAAQSTDIWSIVFVGAIDRVRDVLSTRPELANAADPDEGITPLMRLPGDEDLALEMTKLLLTHGADPSRRNKEGLTAADLAVSRGLWRVAALLGG